MASPSGARSAAWQCAASFAAALDTGARRRLLRVACLLIGTFFAARTGAESPASRVDETEYLLFQLFTAGPGFSTEPGRHVLSQLPQPGFFDGEAQRITEFIGDRGDERHRLGIMVGPLAMDYSDDQLRELVDRIFAIATTHQIAVGIHLDDSKFWMKREDLWRDPANVEWLNWKGTPNSGQYLNWGESWKIAPQVCFNSPRMIAEAHRLAAQVIGPAIAANVAKLRAAGKEGLFAGVIVGWETALGQDSDTRSNLGYCALTNRGFREGAPPADPDRELESVVRDWIAIWSEGLAEAGVHSDRIYSHIAFSPRKRFAKNEAGSYSAKVLHTPPEAAFGKGHRPGFSTYPDADQFEEIYAALRARGSPRWASAEGANVDIFGPPMIPAEGMEDYLARMFNHGAAITNLFGWDIGDRDNVFRLSIESEEARAAYRKFLRGEPLSETPLAGAYRAGRAPTEILGRLMKSRAKSYLRIFFNP